MITTQSKYESDVQASPTEALTPGTVLLNGQYRIDRYLASGGFGITYLARDSLERVVVIKECFPEAICNRANKTVRARSRSHLSEYQSLVNMFVREARSIAKLNHPNIVGVHQVFEDNETAYMALDYVEGRDLLDMIESGPMEMTPEDVKALLLKILDAISTVHGQDMLHRDISPDNILVDKHGAPILIDFGAAREEASKKSRALSAVMVVKEGYSPQEFYIAGSQQTPCSDLYALAATFFHLITGRAPPNSQSRLAAIAAHAPDPYKPMVGRV
ncbi:serine/threonine protein kinase, partial [Litoreibacter sp.]|nr:serine/threonine protein kinase [Litoreibacter sp.]